MKLPVQGRCHSNWVGCCLSQLSCGQSRKRLQVETPVSIHREPLRAHQKQKTTSQDGFGFSLSGLGLSGNPQLWGALGFGHASEGLCRRQPWSPAEEPQAAGRAERGPGPSTPLLPAVACAPPPHLAPPACRSAKQGLGPGRRRLGARAPCPVPAPQLSRTLVAGARSSRENTSGQARPCVERKFRSAGRADETRQPAPARLKCAGARHPLSGRSSPGPLKAAAVGSYVTPSPPEAEGGTARTRAPRARRPAIWLS